MIVVQNMITTQLSLPIDVNITTNDVQINRQNYHKVPTFCIKWKRLLLLEILSVTTLINS